MTESECTGEVLFEKVAGLLNDESALTAMGEAVKTLGVPDSAKYIVDIILKDM